MAGSTGEAGYILFPHNMGNVPTEALMTAEPAPKFDVFSYHFYGTVSKRCSAMDKSAGVTPDQALTEAWLARADETFDHYKAVRDRFMPGTQIWITEMAEAACGGDQWAATYLDTFRYVDQMGRLAKRGADVIFHNTLAASDYALIDDVTMEPRPSYWAALGHDAGALAKAALAPLPKDTTSDTLAVAQRRAIVQAGLLATRVRLWTSDERGVGEGRVLARSLRLVTWEKDNK